MSREDWLATSRCHWCMDMRKEHVDGGPCARVTQVFSILMGCDCQAFADKPLTQEEARARWAHKAQVEGHG